MSALHPLLCKGTLLPYTGSSLRPYCLLYIINDILANNRESIIEFGAGVSTILLARLVRANSLKTRILAIDHDHHWTEKTRSRLQEEGLRECVDLVYAPLCATPMAVDGSAWYDEQLIEDSIGSRTFDLVLIDGPPAWEKSKGKARYPALPFVHKRLRRDSAIYIDDAHRSGERSVMERWTHNYNIPFTIVGDTLGRAVIGSGYYADPLTDLAP